MSGKNEWKWPYSLWTIELKPTKLWPPQKSTFCNRQFDFVMGKSTISQRWQVIWDESNGGYSIIHCPNNAMSQRTVYSILRRHRENLGDVKDRPRSGRRRATTTAAGTFHEDANYILHYEFRHQNWQCDKVGVLWVFCKTVKKWTSLVCYGCFPKYPTSGSRNSHFLYSWHCNTGNQAESEH